MISLTKTAALEYGRQGIRVNCVCPGYIKTEIMGARLDQLPGRDRGHADEAPRRRRTRSPRSPRSSAPTDASFVTGAIIPVDGGRSPCHRVIA